jgi:predicted nucleic acid-binding protein
VSGFLLDTNCISELVRPTPEPRVVEWLENADEELLYLSVLTLGEIRKGLTALAHGNRRRRLEHWLDVDLRIRFSGRILPVDEAVAQRWGLLAAHAKRNGTPLPIIDGLLAATAMHNGLTIVSRNTNDFLNSTAEVFNPWRV